MAARGATRQRSAPPDDDEQQDGILRLGESSEDPVYDVLFTLGNDPESGLPVEYNVLTNPPASLLLAYWDKVRKTGGNLAFSWALEQMLGEDGYKAITESKKVSRNDFRNVVEAVLAILINAEREQEVPKSPRSSSRRSGG